LISATDEDLVDIFKPLGLHHQRAKRVRKIIDEYKLKNGILPKNKNELQESSFATLYISSAYELFILKKRSALFDVNMTRVLSRFFDQSDAKDNRNNKTIQELAFNVINVKACKELNWSILDFAALVCQARKPRCEGCILKSKCSFCDISLLIS
jgi:A/G-specific adenine glycosylase